MTNVSRMNFRTQFTFDAIDNEKRHTIVIEYPIILVIWYTIENYFNTNETYSAHFEQYERLTYFRQNKLDENCFGYRN